MTNLFTAGYQGETVRSFISKLTEGKIKVLIDIRENPFSRKPGFSKSKLSQSLVRAGIDYYHFQELGAPRPLRDYLIHEGKYDIFFDKYRNYLGDFRDAIDDLIDIGEKRNICLMCFEKDPHYCHRKVVAELIEHSIGKQINVVHL